MTQVFHRSREKIPQGKIGPYNTPNNCKTKTDFQQKITFHTCSNHVLISDITSLKRQVHRQERTGHFHVNSKEEWKKLYWGVNIRVQSNRQITQDVRQWHKSSNEAEKKSHMEALDLTTRQNNSKPGEKSNKKLGFQLCSTHVLFPNITSIKRQMQRQERTGHFHVNPKEEWNIFYYGVNHRVQSNRQFTQDIRQGHKSSFEAEKKSDTEKLGRTTRQITVKRKQTSNKNSPFIYVRTMC